jgi:hypothetical protein
VVSTAAGMVIAQFSARQPDQRIEQGPPKATATHSVEELEAMGVVGLYQIANL